MLCEEGRISLLAYVGTLTLILGLSVPQLYFGVVPNIWGASMWGPFFYYAVIHMILRLYYKSTTKNYQIAIRAVSLAFVFAVSVLGILFAPSNWKPFGLYGCFLSFFHYSEFLSIAWANPTSLTLDSFILNHSLHYAVAAIVSWLEFIIETIFFPQIKTVLIFWIIGVTLCTAGEALRKLAMITAKTSFNHVVQYVKAKDHKLVTTGIYSLMRHPSYVGWFWWSIGTQIILMNPLCIIFYTIVSWKFFNDRIVVEEITLLNFFRQDYYYYQKKVSTGLPFIKGYDVDNN